MITADINGLMNTENTTPSYTTPPNSPQAAIIKLLTYNQESSQSPGTPSPQPQDSSPLSPTSPQASINGESPVNRRLMHGRPPLAHLLHHALVWPALTLVSLSPTSPPPPPPFFPSPHPLHLLRLPSHPLRSSSPLPPPPPPTTPSLLLKVLR